MSEKKTIVIDLDGTLCDQMTSDLYRDAAPRKEVIDRINKLWMSGWDVIIFTARGMNSLKGNVEQCDILFRYLTEEWLRDNRVCYTRLMFGKPSADVYVDNKGLSIDEFITKDL